MKKTKKKKPKIAGKSHEKNAQNRRKKNEEKNRLKRKLWGKKKLRKIALKKTRLKKERKHVKQRATIKTTKSPNIPQKKNSIH